MSPYETIRIVAGILSAGTSTRTKCPWCLGGRTGEESFIITREGTEAKYTCHRATCNHNSSGRLVISGKPSSIARQEAPKSRRKEFFKDTHPPTVEVQKALLTRYQLTSSAIAYYNIKQTDDDDVVVPIYNDVGMQQGTLMRINNPTKGRTKALTYFSENSDKLAWLLGMPEYVLPEEMTHEAHLYSDFLDDTLVLVEDMYSAIKANYFTNSIALLGTHLNSAQAAKIASKGYKRVFLALDADASARAVVLAKRHRVLLPNMRVLLLNKDLKDTPYHTIGTMISENYRRI